MADLSLLKEKVDKLKALLEDPQEGLLTWSMFMCENWKAISEMWVEGIPEYKKKRDIQ